MRVEFLLHIFVFKDDRQKIDFTHFRRHNIFISRKLQFEYYDTLITTILYLWSFSE